MYNYVLHIFLLSVAVTIGFTQEEYTVTENERFITVCIERSDTDLDRNIPFNLSTTMGPGEAECMCVFTSSVILKL